MNLHFVLPSVGEFGSDSFLLLVQVTKGPLPSKDLVENGLNVIKRVLYSLMRIQKQLEVGNDVLRVESVLLRDEPHQIHGRRRFLLGLW